MGPVLVLLNDSPYGSEQAFNGLRVAVRLVAPHRAEVRVFLIGDAVACGKIGQQPPAHHYNIQEMLTELVQAKVPIRACGTCLGSRSIGDDGLIPGVARGSVDDLAQWTLQAAKVVSF